MALTPPAGRPFALPDDVLATADLYAESALLGGDSLAVHDHEAAATLVRPLLYRLAQPAADDPVDLLVCFPFDLSPLTESRSYGRAELNVAFEDERTCALVLQPRNGEVQPGDTQVSTFGQGRAKVGWLFRSARDALRPQGHWSQVLLRLPARCTAVAGRISLRGVLHRRIMGKRFHTGIHTLEDVPFRLDVADAWQVPVGAESFLRRQEPAGPGTWALPPTAPPPEPHREEAGAGWVRRLLIAVDLERYSRSSNTHMSSLQRDLRRTVTGACAYAGIDWNACGRQASGDGYLLVLPPGLDEPGAVANLLDGLALGLDAVNSAPDRPAGLASARMRAALHQGLVQEGPSGFSGHSVVDLCRILDAAPLRTALRESEGTDLVAALSDVLYQDLVPHAYRGLEAGFRQVRVEHREKDFSATAWIQLRPRPARPQEFGQTPQ